MKRPTAFMLLLTLTGCSSEVVVSESSSYKVTISKEVHRSGKFAEATMYSGDEYGHIRSVVIFDCENFMHRDQSAEEYSYYDDRYLKHEGTEWSTAAEGSDYRKALNYACFGDKP